jgi:hypothetical protein
VLLAGSGNIAAIAEDCALKRYITQKEFILLKNANGESGESIKNLLKDRLGKNIYS